MSRVSASTDWKLSHSASISSSRSTRAQSTTSALLELQQRKWTESLDLLAGLSSDEPWTESGGAGELAMSLTGARRVLGDARALARELAAITEGLLYARVDERAGAALEILDHQLFDHEWLAADHITTADLSCAGYLYYDHEFGHDLTAYPHIERWRQAIAALPGWKHPYDLMPGHPIPAGALT